MIIVTLPFQIPQSMTFTHNHHIYVHFDNESEILKQFTIIQQKLDKMATDLTALQAAVARDTTVDESAITLLKGLKAALDAAGTDPVALKALSDQLGSNSDALAAAVSENTPTA